MKKALKRSLYALTIALSALSVASRAGSSAGFGEVQAAGANQYDPDFCDAARQQAAACWYQYEDCGGAEGDGCYDQLESCLEASGIWQCE